METMVYNLVNEIVNRFISENTINESVSQELYHFTTLSSMELITKSDCILMSNANQNASDKYLCPTKNVKVIDSNGNPTLKEVSYPYYVCFSRTKYSGVGYPIMRRNRAEMGKDTSKEWSYALVRLKINGDRLNQTYLGGPVNYFNVDKVPNNPKSMSKITQTPPIRYSLTKDEPNFVKRDLDFNNVTPKEKLSMIIHQKSEYEDRIFSFNPRLENIHKYVNRVDILIKQDFLSSNFNQDIFNKLSSVVTSNLFVGKVFVYTDDKSFNAMNENYIDLKSLFSQHHAVQDKEGILIKPGVFKNICLILSYFTYWRDISVAKEKAVEYLSEISEYCTCSDMEIDEKDYLINIIGNSRAIWDSDTKQQHLYIMPKLVRDTISGFTGTKIYSLSALLWHIRDKEYETAHPFYLQTIQPIVTKLKRVKNNGDVSMDTINKHISFLRIQDNLKRRIVTESNKFYKLYNRFF